MPLLAQAASRSALQRRPWVIIWIGRASKVCCSVVSLFAGSGWWGPGAVYSCVPSRRSGPRSTKVLIVQVVLALLYCSVGTSSTLGRVSRWWREHWKTLPLTVSFAGLHFSVYMYIWLCKSMQNWLWSRVLSPALWLYPRISSLQAHSSVGGDLWHYLCSR